MFENSRGKPIPIIFPLLKRLQQQSLTRRLKYISVPDVTDVMPSSRSEERLYCPTEQVRLSEFLYLPKVTRLPRLKVREQIMLEETSSFPRSRMKDGLILMWLLQHLI